MVISHKYRFIFVKTIKTAGTSIEVYLSPHCGAQDVLTPIQPPVDGHEPRNFGRFYNHFSAWGIRESVPPGVWGDYFKFCVERNPWDKTVSDFCMQRHRSGGALRFGDYLDRARFCRSWELYTDDDGSVLVDRVLRWERLDEELGDAFSRLGVPWGGSLDVRAKSGYRSDDGRGYRDWYTEEQRDLVARAFADEIRTFGYEF